MPSSAPETRYAKSGDLNIAYQVVGDGSLDLVDDHELKSVPGTRSHRRPHAVTPAP